MRNRIILFVFAGVLSFHSCNKEEIARADCQRLQHGIITSGKEEVKAVITKFVNNLVSKKYSQQNINNLVNTINQQCDASAVVLCFDCIYTIPSQSEIRITCSVAGGPVDRTVDISYTKDNEMVFRNLHY
ncbi:MAG: hypothetical protein ACHQFX_08080 [Chitinophagales bacterium]